MSITSIGSKDSSGGFVSFIAENPIRHDPFNEETVLEDMSNQGTMAVEQYIHFGEPESEDESKKGLKRIFEHTSRSQKSHSGKSTLTPKASEKEPMPSTSQKLSTRLHKYKQSNAATTDEADLLTREEQNGKKENHYAAEEGDIELLSSMNKHTLNARDESGWAPAMYAAANGQLEALQLLEFKGIDLNVRDLKGRSLLHLAATFGHEHVICWLLEIGFDINITDFYEMTPLHLAAAANQVSITRLLISNGADIEVEDDRSRTPLKVAQIAGNPEIIDLLRDTTINNI